MTGNRATLGRNSQVVSAAMRYTRLWSWGAGFLLVVLYLVVANDGRHHWHEFRYLYSATFYSTAELMQGVFDPGPAPVRTAEQVAVWYSTELLHIYLLKQLVNLLGMGVASYTIIKTVYAAMLLLAAGLVWKTLGNLGLARTQAALCGALFLINPLTVYLGFKLMGEVPALLFSTCALTLFTTGLRLPRLQILLSTAAGIALTLSVLSSARMILLFLGFWVALPILWSAKDLRIQLVKTGLATWIVFLVSLPVIYWLLGGSIAIYYQSLLAFLSFHKPFPMWMFAIFNLGLVGMGWWLLLPVAWLSSDRRWRRFFLVWLVLSSLPIVLLTTNFLEPRYLATGTIPFVGLAAVALEAVWRLLKTHFWRPATRVALVGIVGLIMVGGTVAAQPFMPYETDANQLLRAVQMEPAAASSTVILLPWNYSDFHFLRFAFPERPIYLVQSATDERGELIHDPTWTARFATMYGNHFLPSAEAFPADFADRKLLYIGWTVLPSLQNLRDLLLFMDRPSLAGYLEASRFINHMSQSWLLQDPRFRLQEVSRFGQYQVYEIKSRAQSIRVEQGSVGASRPTVEVPLWGFFETSFINDSSRYQNPFVDTELEATFLSPSGKTYNFFGFYDGDGAGGQVGNIWKVRFMCLETGLWTWSAMFIDGLPGGLGSFRCVEGSIPGPLRIQPNNPHWLIQANGNHFFPRWYALHELLFIDEMRAQQSISNLLVANGYNMVMMLTAQAKFLTSKGWNRNQYELPLFYPWVNNGKAVYWNMFNLVSWHKLDKILKYLQDREIYVYFFDGLFPNIPPRFPDDQPNEELYIRYVLARVGVHWNVIHNIAFEFSEFMPTNRVNRIGRYIEKLDPFQLLLTVHDTQNFQSFVQGENWLDLANVQYQAGTASSAAVANSFILSNFFGKPVAGTEVIWEGSQKLNAEQVRRGAWGIVLAGSFFLYAEHDINRIGLGDFGAGKAHAFLKIMFDFVDSIPYWTMHPRNELVNPGNLCLANPGQQYVIYSEQGEPVTLDLSAANRPLQIEWLNPRTGQRIMVGEVMGGVIRRFANPMGDQQDWVLYVAAS